jgi:putative hydrolase of the HAD superfamily
LRLTVVNRETVAYGSRGDRSRLRQEQGKDGRTVKNTSHANSPTAVLWDFGGVILSSPFEAFRLYERELGLPEDFIRGLNARNPDTNAWAKMERSEVSLEEFVSLFEAEALAFGRKLDGWRVLKAISGDIRPRMVEALRRCKARFRVACITNNMKAGDGPGMARTPEKAAAVAEVMQLFEHVVESSRVGFRKPDPRIYRYACDLLGVAPEQCIYLDDLGVNLKPARAMGMRTIKVGDPDAAIAELETMVGFPLKG